LKDRRRKKELKIGGENGHNNEGEDGDEDGEKEGRKGDVVFRYLASTEQLWKRNSFIYPRLPRRANMPQPRAVNILRLSNLLLFA